MLWLGEKQSKEEKIWHNDSQADWFRLLESDPQWINFHTFNSKSLQKSFLVVIITTLEKHQSPLEKYIIPKAPCDTFYKN